MYITTIRQTTTLNSEDRASICFNFVVLFDAPDLTCLFDVMSYLCAV